MKRSLVAIVACGIALGTVLAGEHPEHPKAPPAAAGASGLDGKVFSGELGKSGEKSDKDTLTFKDGKFLSSACVAYGFHEASYTATEKDGVTTFTATATNDKGETMSWTGTIKGSALEATAVNKSASGEATYTFKGKAGALKAKGSEHPKGEHPEHPKP